MVFLAMQALLQNHFSVWIQQAWLVKNGLDPRLEKIVHIPRAANLLKPHMWAKHPYVVLHELAHAYHDNMFGFDDPDIHEIYKKAMDKGLYENVLLYTGQHVKHYGATNQMEYFAEDFIRKYNIL